MRRVIQLHAGVEPRLRSCHSAVIGTDERTQYGKTVPCYTASLGPLTGEGDTIEEACDALRTRLLRVLTSVLTNTRSLGDEEAA